MTKNHPTTPEQKALAINLDTGRYGTFAEIGAGQEVARHFFQAGGAAGTVAKTISAYDMTFSDEIYGKCDRYVSRDRLFTMLDHEYGLLEERLAGSRGADTFFFAFADTVAATSFRNKNNGNGWLGMRFQTEPQRPPSDVIIHTNMLDAGNVEQQEALGILGVNLVYGALYLHEHPNALIRSLLDHLGTGRIEVDVIKMLGPAFTGVDNRLLNLTLVRQGHTNAVMLGPNGEIVQPSQVLYKKAVLVERGSFRPVTRVNVDILERARARFIREPEVREQEAVVLAELTIHNLLSAGESGFEESDFLARIETLAALDYPVLISNFPEYHRLAAYFRRYTQGRIGIALGINNLLEIFAEKYYRDLDGGILEGLGRLFKTTVKLYIYPMPRTVLAHYQPEAAGTDAAEVIDAENLRVAEPLRLLYRYLLENGFIESLAMDDSPVPQVHSREVLRRIREGEISWTDHVPRAVADLIRDRAFFGYARGKTDHQ